ncbi:UNVERIFIED_CONTAM: hypothetical protein GTU68_038530 [Idotea baltica]|nr:hypothetical protein [Idotea baltica]
MIDPGLVVEAMEESLARAAKSRYGAEMDIRVSIDRKTGKATFTRVRTVVDEEELENYQAEFTVDQAKQYLAEPQIGDQYIEEVPPVEMGRIAAQSAKQVILQRVREAERDRQFEEFKDRAGTIINGVVKREEYGNVGEKIDIIPWNEDQPTFLVNALQPAEVTKVVLDEEAERIEVVVPEEQLSLAIGRRGQNVRLASQLTGLDIDIMTEEEESARRQKEFEVRTKLFMDALDVDEFFAQLLVSEGFTNLEEVAYVELDELLVIDGVDEDTAKELQTRARENLEAQAKAALDNARALGVEDSLVEFEGLTPQMIEALAKDDVKTLEDFATCADWELAGGWTTIDGERVKDDGILEPFDMSLEEAQSLVMTARILLGWVDPADLEADETEENEDATAEDSEEQTSEVGA